MISKQTKRILKNHGISLSKKHGQSQLVDERVLRRIVDYGNVNSEDKILEIGPGIGNLTNLLVGRAKEVIAVEKDERLVEVLLERFNNSPNLEIIQNDILELDIPPFDKVIANLPYSISSPVTFKILEQDFDLGILMYQKEFAERMTAKPGEKDYSSLTVNLSFLAETKILEEVPQNAFLPQPKVKSAIVEIKPKNPPFKVKNEDLFQKVVRSAFQHRRKKIRNSLYYSLAKISPKLNLSNNEKRDLIDDAIPKDLINMRAGKITPKNFGKIADALEKKLS